MTTSYVIQRQVVMDVVPEEGQDEFGGLTDGVAFCEELENGCGDTYLMSAAQYEAFEQPTQITIQVLHRVDKTPPEEPPEEEPQ